MLQLTENSEYLTKLLFYCKSMSWNIGIINGYFYSIGISGRIFRFNLRKHYQQDTNFPGLRSTITRISPKEMIRIMKEGEKDYGNIGKIKTV